MKINNGQIDCNPENTYILRYPNDLLDGVIIDLDDNYAFISLHTPGTVELEEGLKAEGIETVEMSEGQDMTEPPHCWVVASLARLVVKEAEAAGADG